MQHFIVRVRGMSTGTSIAAESIETAAARWADRLPTSVIGQLPIELEIEFDGQCTVCTVTPRRVFDVRRAIIDPC